MVGCPLPVFDMEWDVREQESTRQALRDSEERLRQLISTSNDWVWEVDADAVYTYAGPQCLRILGYAPSDIIGRTPFDLMPPDEALRVASIFKPIAAERKAFWGLRNVNLHRDGRLIVLETNGVPILDADGKFRGYRGMDRDVTERDRAEMDLRKSEEQFRRVVEHIGDAVIADDLNGHVVFANDRFLKLFGFSREQLPILGLENYIAPEYREELVNRHQRRMRGEDVPTHFEYEGVRTDGTRLWLEVDVVPVTDREGRIIGTQSAMRDVTQRKRAEQAIFDSEQRLRHLIESSNDWVFETNQSGAYTYAGPQCRELLGYEPEELIGKTALDLMPADEADRVREEFKSFYAEPRPVPREEGGRRVIVWQTKRIRKDGREVVWETNGVPFFDKNGAFRGHRGMIRDITDRYRAEQVLRESEERFRLVADTAPVMIWSSGTDKRCDYFNRPWLEFTGRPLAAELGNGWADGIHPEEAATCLQNYRDAFDQRRSFEMHYRLRRHDGEYRWLLDIGVPRINADGSFAGYIGSCIDITERKRSEEAMASIGRRLIEAHEEERTRIGRELHDDIGQRLALLAVELDRWNQEVPSSPELRKLIVDAQQRIHEISKDAQSLSHRLHSSKLDYLGLARAANSFCRELAEKTAVNIKFEHAGMPQTLPKEVSLALFRVLQEALQNAVKHSGVKDFTVAMRGTSSAIELKVTDSGHGFEEEEALTRQGIGLISMRERLQLVNGELSIQSKPGSGTTIRARVPLQKSASQALAEDRRPDGGQVGPISQGSVGLIS